MKILTKRIVFAILICAILIINQNKSLACSCDSGESYDFTEFKTMDEIGEGFADAVSNYNENISVRTLTEYEDSHLRSYLNRFSEVNELNNKLESDNYVLDKDLCTSIELFDTSTYEGVIYVVATYADEHYNRVLVLITYNERTSKIDFMYAGKIGDGQQDKIKDYYAYRTGVGCIYSDTIQSEFLEPKISSSTICSLGGTFACTVYSAALFAFVPASIVAGLTCGAAFAFVCG